MEHVVIIERGAEGFGAYVPDLPGCVAVGDTEEETRAAIRIAIEMHIADLREQGQPIPPPTSTVEHVRVA
jgi:predicted RNase H-like HicB family nuclease